MLGPYSRVEMCNTFIITAIDRERYLIVGAVKLG